MPLVIDFFESNEAKLFGHVAGPIVGLSTNYQVNITLITSFTTVDRL